MIFAEFLYNFTLIIVIIETVPLGGILLNLVLDLKNNWIQYQHHNFNTANEYSVQQ